MTWDAVFKPDIRAAGEEIKNLVRITSASDTAIDAQLKVAGGPRVHLLSSGVESKYFKVSCSCSRGQKALPCRHSYAVLLIVQERHSDFISLKSEIEVLAPKISPEKQALKNKQQEYRKKQFEKVREKQKALRQEIKTLKRKSSRVLDVPAEAQQALNYFRENGFEISWPPEEEILKEARKTLSRVFHPDKGGSHAETLTLNGYYDVLLEFAR